MVNLIFVGASEKYIKHVVETQNQESKCNCYTHIKNGMYGSA